MDGRRVTIQLVIAAKNAKVGDLRDADWWINPFRRGLLITDPASP